VLSKYRLKAVLQPKTVLHMDRKLIAILVVGAIVMGVTVWRFHAARPPELAKEDRKFMHCSKCGQEMPYEVRRFEQDCVFCSEKGPLVATKESLKKTGLPPSPFVQMIPALLIEVTLLAGAVYWYASRRKKILPEEEELIFECGGCRRKLGYKVSKIGQMGQCPRCKRRFIFPEMAPEENEPPSPWWRQPLQWWKKLKDSA